MTVSDPAIVQAKIYHGVTRTFAASPPPHIYRIEEDDEEDALSMDGEKVTNLSRIVFYVVRLLFSFSVAALWSASVGLIWWLFSSNDGARFYDNVEWRDPVTVFVLVVVLVCVVGEVADLFVDLRNCRRSAAGDADSLQVEPVDPVHRRLNSTCFKLRWMVMLVTAIVYLFYHFMH